MSELEIVKYPDPRLGQSCAQVADFDSTLHKLLDNMKETMYAAQGVGLAAPQVGVLSRITVIDVSEQRSGCIEIINPVITERSGTVESEEGCLSIPDYRETVIRSEKVSVKAFDRSGKEINIEAAGLLAVCLQHELDHLDGVLFIDRISRLKRELFKRWFKKQSRDG